VRRPGYPKEDPQNQGDQRAGRECQCRSERREHRRIWELRGGSINPQNKDFKVVVIVRPVRGQERRFNRNRMVPWAAGRPQKQTVEDAQPGKITGRRHIGAVTLTWHRWNQGRGWQEPGYQDALADHPRGVRVVATAKQSQIAASAGESCRYTYIPLLVEWEGIVRPASQRATAMSSYISWTMLCRGPWGAGEDSGAEGIRYRPHAHPQVMS
jgi:hypothetical protein